jgi:hypothetical protein
VTTNTFKSEPGEIGTKFRLGLTALLESTPINHAATHFGVENHFACFPRVGEAPTIGLLTQPRLGLNTRANPAAYVATRFALKDRR